MNRLSTKFLALLFLSATISLVACNKDDDNADPCGVNWNINNEIADELELVIATSQEYSQNPTTVNCESYKAAYLDYLDALRALENCARLSGQLQSFSDAIDEAESALDNIQC